MQRYLIIGSGIAGMTAAETIREHDPDGRITLVTDEETPFYNRIRLCDFISGELTPDDLQGVEPNWYDTKQIDLKLGTRVETIDARGHKAMTSKGVTLEWDRLLIATGSSPYIPEISGSEKDGVVTLRSLRDAETLVQRAETAKNVVIIGGGLLGLEAGNALLKRGKTVTVLEYARRILPRQLDASGAELLMEKMVGMGFQFHTGVVAQEITGDGNVSGVITSGGTVIPADLVLISAGVRPQSQLAMSIGVESQSGIPVNGAMETPETDIFAAGDCAVYNGTTHGIWATGIEQGRIAGLNMCGKNSHYNDSPFATLLKVTGIYLGSAGNVDPEGTLESFTQHDKGVYKKMVYQKGVLTGCQMVGDIDHFDAIRTMIFDGTPMDKTSREDLEQQLTQGKSVRGDIKKYVCTVCGYVHEGEEPPALCPQCGAPKEKFSKVAPIAPAATWSCTVCGFVHQGDEPPDACPQCMAPKAKFKAQGGNSSGWADEHLVGIAKNAPQDIIDALRANFTGECTEVGMYLAMARQADREGYPEIGRAYTRIALEEAEHAAKFAELLGEVVTPETKTNLQKRVEAEHGACQGKKELATRAKALSLDAIHDTVHEMCKDEARHGQAFAGLLTRYFNM